MVNFFNLDGHLASTKRVLIPVSEAVKLGRFIRLVPEDGTRIDSLSKCQVPASTAIGQRVKLKRMFQTIPFIMNRFARST